MPSDHLMTEPRPPWHCGRIPSADGEGGTVDDDTIRNRYDAPYVAVDGGMSDNPRPALYGARYTARMIGRTAEKPPEPMTVVGRHCEAGDVIAADVLLPGDLRPGDLLAVPCSGAYHHSMASTYNGIGRPPVIAVRNGAPRVLIRRETDEDLQRRDIGL